MKVKKKTFKKTLYDAKSQIYVEKGSKEEALEVERFEKFMADEKFNLISFAKENQSWLEKKVKSKQVQMFNEFNVAVQKQFPQICFLAFQRGLDNDTILKVAGLYVGLSVASKVLNSDFSPKKGINDKYHKWLGSFYEKSLEKMGDKATYRGLSVEETQKKKEHLSFFAQKHKMAANGGRIPFSPESAAMTEIKLLTMAHNQMRQQPKDAEKIMEQYENARNVLLEMVEMDGIPKEDHVKNVKVYFGKMSSYYPQMNQMIEGLAYGEIQKAPAVLEYLTEEKFKGNLNKREYAIWNGEYLNKDGSSFETDFKPRTPLTRDDYCLKLSKLFDHHGEYIQSKGGLHSTNRMVEYLTHVATGRVQGEGYPNWIKENSELNTLYEQIGALSALAYQDGIYDTKDIVNVIHDTFTDYLNITGLDVRNEVSTRTRAQQDRDNMHAFRFEYGDTIKGDNFEFY